MKLSPQLGSVCRSYGIVSFQMIGYSGIERPFGGVEQRVPQLREMIADRIRVLALCSDPKRRVVQRHHFHVHVHSKVARADFCAGRSVRHLKHMLIIELILSIVSLGLLEWVRLRVSDSHPRRCNLARSACPLCWRAGIDALKDLREARLVLKQLVHCSY